MKESRQVELWRDVPPIHPPERPGDLFPEQNLFPSGRQALSQALLRAGLSRSKRVACPEWSSHCVLSAVSRYATPVPMWEATQHGFAVDAVVLYEQWGWPFSRAAWEHLSDMRDNTLLVWDRVDSADFLSRIEMPISSPSLVADMTSLSKLLGLPGGGILRERAQFVEHRTESPSAFAQHLAQADSAIKETFEYKEYLKNYGSAVHPRVSDWMRRNSLSAALGSEFATRQRHLHTVARSPCAVRWERWMVEAVEDGAAPGIAPLLRGSDQGALNRAKLSLAEDHQVHTEI